MTSPQDPQHPREDDAVVPPAPEAAPEEPAVPTSWAPSPEPEPETEVEPEPPAWADADLFADADEPEYDEWAAEQDPFPPAEGEQWPVPAAESEPEPEQVRSVSEPEPEPEPERVVTPEVAAVAAVAAAPIADPVVPEQVVPAQFVPAAAEAAEPVAEEPEQDQPEQDEPADEPAEPETEAVEEAEGEEPVVPETRSAPVLVTLLALAVAVLIGLTAFLAVAVAGTRGDGDDNRRAALAGARNAARLVFSYDYRHLAQDFAAGRAVTTGAFRSEYDRTTERLVNDVAPRYKAVVAADVSDAAVVSAHGDRATVLVFVDQQSSSTLSSAPKLTQSRLEMTMVRSGGQWKVANIKAF